VRFEDVGDDVYRIMEGVITTEHTHLQEASIVILFDNKKRKSGERYVLGRIKATSEEMKAFAVNEQGQMYDYVMFLDKEVWLRISEDDQKALVSHELCHCKVTEGENPYKIQGHEIETFYSEIDRNADDPRWAERLGLIASHVHDPENYEMPTEE
jgi:hypothetical protein